MKVAELRTLDTGTLAWVCVLPRYGAPELVQVRLDQWRPHGAWSDRRGFRTLEGRTHHDDVKVKYAHVELTEAGAVENARGRICARIQRAEAQIEANKGRLYQLPEVKP